MVIMLCDIRSRRRLRFELRSRKCLGGEGWLNDVVAQMHVSHHKVGKVLLHFRVDFRSRESAL